MYLGGSEWYNDSLIRSFFVWVFQSFLVEIWVKELAIAFMVKNADQ